MFDLASSRALVRCSYTYPARSFPARLTDFPFKPLDIREMHRHTGHLEPRVTRITSLRVSDHGMGRSRNLGLGRSHPADTGASTCGYAARVMPQCPENLAPS